MTTTKEYVNSFNNMSHVPSDDNITKMTAVLPAGWHKLIPIIFETASICKINISALDIKQGTLYIKGVGEYQNIFNRVARSLMMDSALTCMVCGKYGRRRKDESGSPSLCGAHYLDYINEEEINVQ